MSKLEESVAAFQRESGRIRAQLYAARRVMSERGLDPAIVAWVDTVTEAIDGLMTVAGSVMLRAVKVGNELPEPKKRAPKKLKLPPAEGVH